MLVVPLTIVLGCQTDDGPAPLDSAGGGEDTQVGGDGGDGGGDDTAPLGDPVSEVSWALHDEIESIVVVSWTQAYEAEVSLSFGVEGEETWSTPTATYAAGAQSQLLLGLPYDASFQFSVVSGDYTSEVQAGSTGALPETVPPTALMSSREGDWHEDDRWMLVSVTYGGSGWTAEGTWIVFVDRKGRIVWAYETPDEHRTFYNQFSPDGTRIVWDETTFWSAWDGGADSQVHRMAIDGTIEETIPTPGLHHAFLELPDGTIVWGGLDGETELIWERDPSGEVRTLFDCSAYWREQTPGVACDGNALSWRESDDTLLFSSDSGHSIVHLDRKSGEVIKSFGRLDDSWGFADEATMFWKQHSPNFLDDGNLLLSTWASETDHELRAREYELDEDNEQLVEVWACGEGSGLEGDYAGEAHRLPSGNTLLNYGAGSALIEYAPDCSVVWHVQFDGQRMTGRSLFVADLYALVP